LGTTDPDNPDVKRGGTPGPVPSNKSSAINKHAEVTAEGIDEISDKALFFDKTGAGSIFKESMKKDNAGLLFAVGAAIVAGGKEGKALTNTMREVVKMRAGFAKEGIPIIVDNSIGVNPQKIANELRKQGFNARSVTEIFGNDPGDANILKLAEAVKGRVLATDRGRNIGGGFGKQSIPVSGKIRQTDTIVRIVKEEIK
jgi:hypothetical protein